MRKAITVILVALLCWACQESVTPATYNGIGSIERNDTVAAIHYYDHTFLIEDMPMSLVDSSRVIFRIEVTGRANDTTETYNAKIIDISSDIRREIININSTAGLGEESGVMVSDLHLTRDFRRLDYFNITTIFETREDNDDKINLVLEQRDDSKKEATLWIKHWQKSTDSLNIIQKDIMSVPMNGMINDETSERLLLHVKWIKAIGDTISEDFTYSYYNK
ncbi:MAG: hypothetical protein MJZ13_03100 [Bacteroidales bacterium]|nr:hypothetical protein [Bacteroidales bacterium]